MAKFDVRAAFDKYAEGGVVQIKFLYKLLQDVGLPFKETQYIVQVQAGLRYLYKNGSIEDGIPFELFSKWYKLETTAGHYEDNNELLVRKIISKVKLPTRVLREGAFVYGQKNQADKEGAGEVVLNWVSGTRSKSKTAGISILKVNKAAVKAKKLTPKQFNDFKRENSDDKRLQRSKVLGQKKDRGPRRDPNIIYGLPSAAREYENVSEIIFAGDKNLDDSPYVDTSGQCVKGKLPLPRSTKCSELLKKVTKDSKEQKQREEDSTPWKMKKFSNTQPKLTKDIIYNEKLIARKK